MYNKNMEEVLPNMYLVLAFLVFFPSFSPRELRLQKQTKKNVMFRKCNEKKKKENSCLGVLSYVSSFASFLWAFFFLSYFSGRATDVKLCECVCVCVCFICLFVYF